MQKGIAFPCCVSVNNCICHFSPMNSDPDVTLKVCKTNIVECGPKTDDYINIAEFVTGR